MKVGYDTGSYFSVDESTEYLAVAARTETRLKIQRREYIIDVET